MSTPCNFSKGFPLRPKRICAWNPPGLKQDGWTPGGCASSLGTFAALAAKPSAAEPPLARSSLTSLSPLRRRKGRSC